MSRRQSGQLPGQHVINVVNEFFHLTFLFCWHPGARIDRLGTENGGKFVALIRAGATLAVMV
jgi:hypothetical protein